MKRAEKKVWEKPVVVNLSIKGLTLNGEVRGDNEDIKVEPRQYPGKHS